MEAARLGVRIGAEPGELGGAADAGFGKTKGGERAGHICIQMYFRLMRNYGVVVGEVQPVRGAPGEKLYSRIQLAAVLLKTQREMGDRAGKQSARAGVGRKNSARHRPRFALRRTGQKREEDR